jgi:cytochrome c
LPGAKAVMKHATPGKARRPAKRPDPTRTKLSDVVEKVSTRHARVRAPRRSANFGILIVVSAALALAQGDNVEKLIKGSDCSSCHAVDREIVGPAYSDIAKRYAGQADAAGKLAAKVRDGGSGMTPHPDLTETERREIVAWILSRKDAAVNAIAEYPHTLPDGTTVKLDFPVYADAKGPKVTKEVFHGYQLFNSYCYRCHGTDASGGQLAPDLRHSLTAGMKRHEFLSVAAIGKADKGMPAWAGFLSGDDLAHIYQYVKGRSLDLVPSGRPPSTQD